MSLGSITFTHRIRHALQRCINPHSDKSRYIDRDRLSLLARCKSRFNSRRTFIPLTRAPFDTRYARLTNATVKSRLTSSLKKPET